MLMASKLIPYLFPWLFLPTCILIFLYSALLPLYPTAKPKSPNPDIPLSPPSPCNLFKGKWVFDPTRRPIYDATCPFHRNAWNCIKNQREKMGRINSWKWVPENCELNVVDPIGFLNLMRNRNIGFVGDSLNENFLAAFLCVLRVADDGATKWKRKGAWRGAYFPKFNVTVAYHRAVLLAKYEWQTKQPELSGQDGMEGMYRVDVDVPADDWANIAEFYDVLVFNTGHWWGEDKFPKETPLVFFQGGQPIHPPLKMLDGLNIVLEHMVDHIEKTFPKKALKFWRLQSPRHFYGGEWNHNGSCLFDKPLEQSQTAGSTQAVQTEYQVQVVDYLNSSCKRTSVIRPDQVLNALHVFRPLNPNCTPTTFQKITWYPANFWMT
ncbi:protein trichome birefringence-like 12 isoform X2 [Primulina eburnea]|uniref:protein trichome birefringence-like 12 isoform X2 n=1 Tax=Primulina eburnea TaxID=1245227 RepID=UPI003C6C082A